MDAKGIAFLRGIGLPEEALEILARPGEKITIDAASLDGWLKVAYVAGRKSRQEVYAWYSVEELMDRPLA